MSASQSVQVSMSPVIVTGGCGFIGSHIVDAILEAEPTCEVHIMDIQTANFADGLVRLHLVDIADAEAVKDVFQMVKPKVVFHVATANAMSASKRLLQDVIVHGTRNLLESAKKLGTVQAFVYTSTSSLVHDNVSNLIDADESMPVLQYPQQKKQYTLCKAVAEAEVLATNRNGAGNTNGMLTAAIRPAGNFGPRDYTNMGKVVASIRAGKGKYQLGDGKNKYSFTYVANTADAQLLAARALIRAYGKPPLTDGDKRVEGEVFNITNDEDWLFWDYQRAVAASIGYPVKPEEIVVVPFWLAVSMAWISEWLMWIVTLGQGKQSNLTWEAVYYATHHRTIKCDKAKRILGYRPRVSMQDGLNIAGRWFVEQEESGRDGRRN